MTGMGDGTGMGPSMLLFAHVQAQVMRPDMFRLESGDTRRAMEKFYVPKNLGQEGPKKFWVRKKFGSGKILDPKKF